MRAMLQAERVQHVEIFDAEDAVIRCAFAPEIVSSSQRMAGKCDLTSPAAFDDADLLSAGEDLQRVAGQCVVRFDAAFVHERQVRRIRRFAFRLASTRACALCSRCNPRRPIQHNARKPLGQALATSMLGPAAPKSRSGRRFVLSANHWRRLLLGQLFCVVCATAQEADQHHAKMGEHADHHEHAAT